MRLDYLVGRYAGLSFEGVDVLRETGVQFPMLVQKTNEDMGGGRYKFSWCEFSSECVD